MEDLYHSIALYDWQHDTDANRDLWYQISKKLFEHLVIDIDQAVYGTEDKSGSASRNKIESVLIGKGKLYSTGGVQLLAHKGKGAWSMSPAWFVQATLSATEPKQMYFGISADFGMSLLQFGELIIENSVLDVGIMYGIGYTMDISRGPEYYSSGLIYGYSLEDTRSPVHDATGAWFRELLNRKRHLDGMLRDVYPWNLLTEKHLAQACGEITLEDWINKNPKRGKLKRVTNDRTLWTIPNKSIPMVRKILNSFELLICPDLSSQ